jgi:hypothetical protein
MDSLLQHSLATTQFKADLLTFLLGEGTSRVKVESPVPQVKVRRLLTQLIAFEPHLQIEHVVIRARSGCSDFVGSVAVHTTSGAHVFDFVWDCRWRAENEGYVDYFGLPDQARAAEEFDWQCFQEWKRRSNN